MIDLERYQARARRYLAAKGVPEEIREDLVQEICLEVLEHPERVVNLGYLAQHALDRLDPRTTTRTATDTRRLRTSERLAGLSLDQPLTCRDEARRLGEVLAAPAPGTGDALARVWLARQVARMDARTAYILRRYFWDDVEMHTIAAEVGCTESRISQVITEALLALGTRYMATTSDAWPGWALAWRVAWITL